MVWDLDWRKRKIETQEKWIDMNKQKYYPGNII